MNNKNVYYYLRNIVDSWIGFHENHLRETDASYCRLVSTIGIIPIVET